MKRLTFALFSLVLFFGSANAQAQNSTASQSDPRPRDATQTNNATAKDALAKADEDDDNARAARTIRGRVVDEAGQPIANAQVWMTTYGARFRNTTTETDADGNFTFENVSPGVYMLQSNAPTYAPPAPSNTPRALYRPGDTALLQMIKGGVITGKVTDQNGEPLVEISVHAVRVRDLDNKTTDAEQVSISDLLKTTMTDDRGIYRIYGLLPGVYVVQADGRGLFSQSVSAFADNAPTFYPSSPRDTAQEVVVRGGQETSGIDIWFRGEKGHSIGGKVIAANVAGRIDSVTIWLRESATRAAQAITNIYPFVEKSGKFAFDGVGDGEYEIVVTGYDNSSRREVAAASQKVIVRGADISGLTINLAPIPTIAGRVLIVRDEQVEKTLKTKNAACPQPKPSAFVETIITARASQIKDDGNAKQEASRRQIVRDAVPDKRGEFTLNNMEAGEYRLSVNVRDESLWVRRLARTIERKTSNGKTAQTQTQTIDLARERIALNAGEQITNVFAELAAGAAALRGRIVKDAKDDESKDGSRSSFTVPAGARVYLAPMEKERADDALRYAAARVRDDNSFTFAHLAPGKYRALLRIPDAKERANISPAIELFADANARAALRREAEANGIEIELQPCQRLDDFALKMK
jgi:protocatechuate 3,4-dioxygenase beta subunit